MATYNIQRNCNAVLCSLLVYDKIMKLLRTAYFAACPRVAVGSCTSCPHHFLQFYLPACHLETLPWLEEPASEHTESINIVRELLQPG